MSRPAPPREVFRPERLLAFSDGVFGVAITLLVIDLRLPVTDGDDSVLLPALLAMWPKLFIFAFTFLIVGVTWLGHHRKFSYIHAVDTRLLWLNLLYLMALCLVPFGSSVLSEHGSRYAFILYAAIMIVLDLFSAALSAYGLRAPFLAKPDLPAKLRQDMLFSPLATAGIFLVAAGLEFAGMPSVANGCLFLIIPVLAYFGRRGRPTA
jgi:uncharacterized membrane protein